MPATNSQISNSERDNASPVFLAESSASFEAESGLAQSQQLNSVMSELNRLSKSFVHSYQNLEGQVEKLNGQLQNETTQKNNVLQEKQKLMGEKAFLSDRLQSLLSIMPAGVVVIDSDGKVKDCNAKAVDILGRPLLGELWISVINRVIDPQADDGHQISLKDGRKIHIETRALDVEPGQLVVLTDLTKSRQLQAEQTQQKKLSSMGKMIASLAHQIRTPLSAAILYGSHLNKETLPTAMKRQFGEQLMERLQFMDRQINDMLGFIRGERSQKKPIKIIDFFQQCKQMKPALKDPVDYLFKNNSEAQRSKFISIDSNALIGAINNLVENGCHACCHNDRKKVLVEFSIASQLTIKVIDKGVGIAREDLQKIFEPFYTTKENGNGLGLAIVYGIVVDHAGTIRVDSRLTEGTCIEISLPLILPSSHAHGEAAQSCVSSISEASYEF